MTGDPNRPTLITDTDLALPQAASEPTADEAVWQAARARQRLMSVVELEAREHRFFPSSVWIGIAAAIVIGVVGLKYVPNITGASHTSPTKTYATNSGERANVTLDDGSQVVLAPATTMRVDGRNVDLTGEAVFTVTQNTGNPFTVRTQNTITKVLGTTFGIRAYTEQVRIAVSEGKISISDPKQLGPGQDHPRPGRSVHILDAGDAAEIDSRGTTIFHNTDVSAFLSWTTGTLQFRDMPVPELLTQLSHWYGFKFKVDNPSVNTRIVTGRFTNESRADVIRGLELLLDVHARVAGDSVILR